RKGRRVTPDIPHVQAGDSIVLTLDPGIQRATEAALDEAMERTQAQAAHAVVMDVRTGDLLAVANRPTVNPNDTSSLTGEQLKNRAVVDSFEPGSVFKPFVVAAALEEEILASDSIVNCENGAWAIGRKVIHDTHRYDDLTVAEVIKFSSNIGSAKIAFDLGADHVIGYLKAFGYGRSTGLGLPGEVRGIIRSPERIKKIELATTSYGHGVTASTVQITAAMATLGNDGVRMQPRLIQEYRDPHGETIRIEEPEVDRRVVSEQVAREVVEMLAAVTEAGGTGTQAQVEGYRVAGKTGTAWKHVNGSYSSTDRIGTFSGLVPADEPRLAITVVVDTPTVGSSYGGVVAGPAFSQIAQRAVRLLGLPPTEAVESSTDAEEDGDTPSATPAELVWNLEEELIVPDLVGLSMREALVTLQGAGLQVGLQGTGRVWSQRPEPGVPVVPGDRVEVVLQ
ncbi:MAG: penicillin-binding protein, partial [Myxococcota bacterium]|nr:penicillin-binding protein [Myxococcota bacterium]